MVVVQDWSIEKNKSTSNLWVVDVASGAGRRLTTAAGTDGAPVWSPDGRRIAFVSKRGDDEVAALYVIPADGGEAEKLLELPYAVASPKWMPDGTSIVVSTTVIPELAGAWSKARPRGDQEGDQASQGLQDDGPGDGAPAVPVL